MATSKVVKGKLEDFFNPGPNKLQASSRDIEDPIDIYDHTKQFFDKS
jgi:Skp family chaperone for outer membrane proteins